MTRRASLARDTYGKPRNDDDATTTGKKARARNLRVSRIDEATWCTDCDRPKTVCPCDYLNGKRVKHADSVQEKAMYRTTRTRRMMYRSVGRMA